MVKPDSDDRKPRVFTMSPAKAMLAMMAEAEEDTVDPNDPSWIEAEGRLRERLDELGYPEPPENDGGSA